MPSSSLPNDIPSTHPVFPKQTGQRTLSPGALVLLWLTAVISFPPSAVLFLVAEGFDDPPAYRLATAVAVPGVMALVALWPAARRLRWPVLIPAVALIPFLCDYFR